MNVWKKLNKNNFVVLSLFVLCMSLILLIFGVSNRDTKETFQPNDYATKSAVKDAFLFLEQEEAIEVAMTDCKEEITYGDYESFLKQLHLWDVLSDIDSWDEKGNQRLLLDDLSNTRNQILDLFGTTFENGMVSPSGWEELHETTKEVTSDQADISVLNKNSKIRVLLLQADQPTASDILFSANEPFEINWHGQIKTKKRKQVIAASQLRLKEGESARITSKKGKLYLADQSKERRSLMYDGSFEILRCQNGYAVINEVTIEKYLLGVVQSEMPAYFETEALKAQAVCARTYACRQLFCDNYPEYHADVDDSVRFQVYNKIAPDERVIAAVQATKGMILTDQNAPIEAYFFSASHGVTAGLNLWNLPQKFYLKPVAGNATKMIPSIQKEEQFLAYIREKDETAYDYESNLYRWKAMLNLDKNQENAKQLLQKICENNENCVIVKDRKGKQVLSLADIRSIGNVQRLIVGERDISGGVLKLRIQFENGEVVLSNEYYIRQLLGLWVETLQNKDGTFIKAPDLLPSDYFAIVPVKEGICLLGGGLGHGIGMSQYGANGLAKLGADMNTILTTYYGKVEQTKLY